MDIFIGLFIYAIVPLGGLALFIKLVDKMETDNIVNPPVGELFLIFSTYGGLLLVALTTLFWEWSGMASLGAVFLVLGGPILMGIISYRNFKLRYESKYRKWTFLTGLFYFIIMPLVLGGLIFFESK